jgi:hypothetical protein
MAIYYPNQSITEIPHGAAFLNISLLNITGGTVVQTVEQRHTSYLASSNSAQNDFFSASITPKSASNKILVYAYAPFRVDAGAGTWSLGWMWVHNTTRNVGIISSGWNGTWRNTISSYEKHFLDSPNSTAPQTYVFRVSNFPGTTVYWGNHPTLPTQGDGYSYIRMQEISV